jgi:hypothetical protein
VRTERSKSGRLSAAGEALRHAAAEYEPIAAEKAQAAAEAVRHAAAEYEPIAAEKLQAAGHAAQQYAMRARERLAS